MDYATKKELAEIFRCSVSTVERRLREMKRIKEFDRYIIPTGRVRADVSAYDFYLKHQKDYQAGRKIKMEV